MDGTLEKKKKNYLQKRMISGTTGDLYIKSEVLIKVDTFPIE